jgi:UDP-N-acetylglucosamine 2-epimerase (non-hydrolysing)
MNLELVLGARPQIIKSAPLIHLASKDKQIHLDIIHTGQHYDYEMTKIFFEEFNLPDPLVNLNVGSGSHAQQTARVMVRLEKVLEKQKPDLVLVPGDTNSTLAGALTAAKLHVPVAHVEAGARSYDMRMPEEVNRRLTDHCSSLLFTPTDNCTGNLLKEGIDENKIRQTGDPMYDVLLQQLPVAERSKIVQQLDLEPKHYALVTVHRPENTDSPQNLKNITTAMTRLQPLTIVFPVHPRTKRQLKKLRLLNAIQKRKHIKLIRATGYHETLKLMQKAALVLTDSGGMQKEAFWLKTPCITMRENTEWIETVQLGANSLTDADTERIAKTVRQIMENQEETMRRLEKLPNPFGDGKASCKMISAIKAFWQQKNSPFDHDVRNRI